MHGSKTVLVIDDDPAMREVLRLVIEDEGLIVATADDGREAVESVARLRPGLVLLDLMLPHLDGERVAEALRAAHGNGLPIVLMSGTHGADAVARRIGAAAFLCKPFDLDELLAVIRRCLPPVVAGGALWPSLVRARLRRNEIRRLTERIDRWRAEVARAKERLAELRAGTRALLAAPA